MTIQEALKEIPNKPGHLARRPEWRDSNHLHINDNMEVSIHTAVATTSFTVDDLGAEDYEFIPKTK